MAFAPIVDQSTFKSCENPGKYRAPPLTFRKARLVLSCDACRRTKTRCDKEEICSNCVAKGIECTHLDAETSRANPYCRVRTPAEHPKRRKASTTSSSLASSPSISTHSSMILGDSPPPTYGTSPSPPAYGGTPPEKFLDAQTSSVMPFDEGLAARVYGPQDGIAYADALSYPSAPIGSLPLSVPTLTRTADAPAAGEATAESLLAWLLSAQASRSYEPNLLPASLEAVRQGQWLTLPPTRADLVTLTPVAAPSPAIGDKTFDFVMDRPFQTSHNDDLAWNADSSILFEFD